MANISGKIRGKTKGIKFIRQTQLHAIRHEYCTEKAGLAQFTYSINKQTVFTRTYSVDKQTGYYQVENVKHWSSLHRYGITIEYKYL